jgi:transcriptional regulator with XRE-family HTH domain
VQGRELHGYIRQQIERRLGGRSWKWLAEEAGVARTTLITQAARPRFSVEVLVRVAGALERDVAYFLPQDHDQPSVERARKALHELERYLQKDPEDAA